MKRRLGKRRQPFPASHYAVKAEVVIDHDRVGAQPGAQRAKLGAEAQDRGRDRGGRADGVGQRHAGSYGAAHDVEQRGGAAGEGAAGSQAGNAVGDGDGGRLLLREIVRNPQLGMSPVGRAVVRNVTGGVLAMIVTYGIGALVGGI